MTSDGSIKDSEKQRKVYVVYKFKTKKVIAICTFLKEKLGLEFLSEKDAINMTDEPSPFIGDVIDVAFENAQAVIVLLTGNEQVMLCPKFQRNDDEEFEKTFYHQPTQEQIFQAGYAFGKSPKHTALVQIGDVRPFSDIAGRHILDFTGTTEDYNLLQTRLKLAGCMTKVGSEVDPPEKAEDASISINPKKVFVVHGRNIAAKKAMFAFLRSLDLTPIDWGQAVNLTKTGAPYTGEAIVAGVNEAQAVVVLLTGDDLVQIPRRGKEGKPSQVPQARPNVLFEAGMAFSRHKDSTILVQLGNLRPCRSIKGRSMIKLSNKSSLRRLLMERLYDAGCPVNFNGNWHSSGDFDVHFCYE